MFIDEVLENKESLEKKYVCPICKNDMIIKNGKIVTPHFAHKSRKKCDTFSQDMSEWHKDWQNVFPKENQEYVLRLNLTTEQYLWAAEENGFLENIPDEYYSMDDNDPIEIVHRADVCISGYVIEFQHSPISCEEFNERNWFYRSCEKKVIWIFDFTEKTMFAYKRNCYSKKWKWNYASKTFIDFLPQYYKKRKDEYTDKWKDSSILLFFQTEREWDEEDKIIDLVTWAIEDDYGDADFRRFTTSLKHNYSKKEFRRAVLQRKL